MTRETIDRFARWPLYFGIVILAFLAFVTYWPVAQIAFSLLFLLWAIPLGIIVLGFLIAAIWCGVVALFTSRWRRMLSMLALPVMLVLSFPAALVLNYLENELTFLLYKSRYAAEVAKVTAEGRHMAWVADWGGGVMIGFNRFVFWDENDEIMLSSSQQSVAWQREIADIGGISAKYRVQQNFGDHFYLIDE